jgi:hypothetical protein
MDWVVLINCSGWKQSWFNWGLLDILSIWFTEQISGITEFPQKKNQRHFHSIITNNSSHSNKRRLIPKNRKSWDTLKRHEYAFICSLPMKLFLEIMEYQSSFFASHRHYQYLWYLEINKKYKTHWKWFDIKRRIFHRPFRNEN